MFVLIIGFAVYSNACRCLVTATPLCAYCCCCCPTASVREGGRDSDNDDDEDDGSGSSGDEGAGSESEGEGEGEGGGDKSSAVAGIHASDRYADASVDDSHADGKPRMRTHSAQHHQQQQHQQYQQQQQQHRDVSFSFPSRDDERTHSRSHSHSHSPAQPAITAAHADDFARQFFSSSSSSSSSSDSSSFSSSSAYAHDSHSHPFPASGGSGRTLHFEHAAPSSLYATGFLSPLGRAPSAPFHPPASVAATAASDSDSVRLFAHSPSDAHTHTVLVGADEAAGAVVTASDKKKL